MRVGRKSALYLLGTILWTISGCHVPIQAAQSDWDGLSETSQQEEVVQTARTYLGHRHISVPERSYPSDCSGFVAAVLFRNGIDVFQGADELQLRGNGVSLLHQFFARYGELRRDGSPKPGDLVFFSNTFDRNKDGKLNDPLTHVGIVEEVRDDHTIYFLHHLQSSVRRYAMNLRFPDRHVDGEGRIINSFLRRKRRRDRANTPFLTGALFFAFGSLSPSAKTPPTHTSFLDGVEAKNIR